MYAKGLGVNDTQTQVLLNFSVAIRSICLVCMANEALEVWCKLFESGVVKMWVRSLVDILFEKFGENYCTLGEY